MLMVEPRIEFDKPEMKDNVRQKHIAGALKAELNPALIFVRNMGSYRAYVSSRFVGSALNRDTGLQVVEDLQTTRATKEVEDFGGFFMHRSFLPMAVILVINLLPVEVALCV